MVSKILPTRKLGKNGPEVTALGFGCMVCPLHPLLFDWNFIFVDSQGLSAFYTAGKMSYEESFKFLDHLIERGCTFWVCFSSNRPSSTDWMNEDTADMYRDNEDL